MRFAQGTPRFLLLGQAILAAALLLVFVKALEVARLDPPLFSTAVFLYAVATLLWLIVALRFFNDPDREVGHGLVSPADGRVRSASIEGGTASLSIFLGIFDVHVVRAPVAGRVGTLEHRSGGKRFAFSKESDLNERVVLQLESPEGTCVLTLIAGALADRIEPYVKVGDALSKGERLGIIKFGSRVDMRVGVAGPVELLVKVGDKVKAAETTVLAPAAEAARA